MTTPNENGNRELMPDELLDRFQYDPSLLNHWIENNGIDFTLDLLSSLRTPNDSIWVQVNKSRIDFDSLIDIFEDMDFEVSKHPHFDDILLVRIGKNTFTDEEKSLPGIKVEKESTSSVALGKDVNSNSITDFISFSSGDKVKIMDFVGNIIAIGRAEINSSELKDKAVRVAAKNIKAMGNAPQLTEMMVYRRGYFNILTPVQVLAVKSMNLKSAKSILVISGDKGDVASYIEELTEQKIPITLIVNNKLHLKAVSNQLKRTRSKSIRIVRRPTLEFLNGIHEMKYDAVYVEAPNSRTAFMPTFSSNLGFSRLKSMAKTQKEIISQLYHCLYSDAEICYVTHSVDFLENELIFDHIMNKAYYEDSNFAHKIRQLKKKDIFSNREQLEHLYGDYSFEHRNSTIYVDPVKTNNTGGYIARFKFGKTKEEIN